MISLAGVNAFAAAWAELIWRATWQGGVALLLVLLVGALIRQIAPGTRCWLWRLAFFKLLLAGLWLSPVELRWLPPSKTAPMVVDRAADRINRQATTPLEFRPDLGPVFLNSVPQPRTSKIEQTPPSILQQPKLSLRSWLMLAWTLGVLVSVAHLVRQWRQMRVLVRSLMPTTNPSLRQVVADGCRQMGMRHAPELRVSAESGSPCLLGILRPVIVLPNAVIGACSPEALNAAVLHELAHIRRRDLLWNWLPALVETLFFFHPLVWLARREWRLAQEMATDELAVSASRMDSGRYARLLVELVAHCRAATFRPHLVVGVSETYSQLRRRMTVMLTFQALSPRRRLLTAATVTLVAATGLVPWKLTARPAQAAPVAEVEATATREATIKVIEALGGDLVYDETRPGRPVISISLHSKKVNDELVASLKVFSDLKALTLDATQVSDAGLAHLKDMTSLGALDLNATGITDAGLAHLKSLKKIEQLGLIGTKISDAGLVHLTGMPNMVMLLLGDTEISDAGLVHLQGMVKLKTLSLDGTQISDVGLVHLAGMKDLLDLRLNNSNITDAGLLHLKPFFRLQTLDISQTSVTDAGLLALNELPNLRSLWLGDTSIGDAGLGALKTMTGLTTLQLPKTKITNAGLMHLKALVKLESLNVDNNRPVTEAAVKALKAGLPGCKVFWNPSPENDYESIVRLVMTNAESLEQLLTQFDTAEYAWQQYEVAKKLIERKDGWDHKALIVKFEKLVDVPDRQRRCNAAYILAGLGDPRGTAILIAELRDKNPRPTTMERSDGRPDVDGQIRGDRHRAALLLGELKLKPGVPALIEATADKSINYQAAISLGHIGDRSAVPALRQMTVDFPDQRLWAGYGLAALDEPQGLEILTEMALSAPNWSDRRHAVEALGKLGNRQVLSTLAKALKDEQANVRVSAARSLGMLGDVEAIAALTNSLNDTEQTPFHQPTTTAAEAQKAIELIRSKQPE